MYIPQFLAQTSGTTPGAGDMIGFMVPMVAVAAVFYFFMIRPQQTKAKEHQNMLTKVTRGDTVVTNGGLIGKVVRVTDENELLVEVGENVKVRVLRQGLADVRSKGEPMKAEAANDSKKK